MGEERFVKFRIDDFESVYAAVKYFNEMGEDADINHSLDLLEGAQKIMESYLPLNGSKEATGR